MLRLSEEIGQPVWTAGGERVGKLVDLTILHGDTMPVVHQLVVRSGQRLVAIGWDGAELRSRRPDRLGAGAVRGR